MLTHAETNGYREQLLALMSRIERDRGTLKDEALRTTGGEASGGLSDIPLHLADLGSHGFEEELTLDLVKNADQVVEEIKAALARLDEGVFGNCETCNKAIAKDRLRVLPYARYCIACARKHQEKTAP